MDIPANAETGATLLYVEDDHQTQKMVTLMISRKFPNLTLILAGNGREGLDLFASLRPDIS